MAELISPMQSLFSTFNDPNVDFLSKLPNEVQIEVLKSVTGKDIISMKQVNIRFYYLIDKNADILPKFRHQNHKANRCVVLIFQNESRAQSMELTEWTSAGANSRRNVERQLRVAANSGDTCHFELDLETFFSLSAQKFVPIEKRGQLISLKHYSYDSIKIRRPINLKAVTKILQTGNNVVKNLHIDINTNSEEIKQIVALFVHNLDQISFEFCDPTACLNEEFLKKLSEVKFIYCHESRIGLVKKLYQNRLFFDKIHFEHCGLLPSDLDEYITEFLQSDQEKTCCVFVKVDEKNPNLVNYFAQQSNRVFIECQKLFAPIPSNITSNRIYGRTGQKVEMTVGGKKLILEFMAPARLKPWEEVRHPGFTSTDRGRTGKWGQMCD